MATCFRVYRPGTLALRLPADEREKFLKNTIRRYSSRTALSKRYVTVPDALLKNGKELRKYFELRLIVTFRP